MKKIDKLMLRSFIGPLILTFLVVIFILLSKQMLYYFDDIIGKSLGFQIVSQFLLYFAVLMFPAAMPLAILLASLIAFGNLAEHFELTAIKASGISILQVLRAVFLFVLLLTVGAFYVNNYLVPSAALESYTLLYDIKQKKPALDIREGVFYDGIPGISIKVNKKFPDDDAALKNIILYNHRENDGNNEILIADSGRMTTILNQRYLRFEFFNGYQYTGVEGTSLEGQLASGSEILTRRTFRKSEVVVDLSSFDLTRTDARAFESHRMMKTRSQLCTDIDSLNRQINHVLSKYKTNFQSKLGHLAFTKSDHVTSAYADSLFAAMPRLEVVKNSTNAAREMVARLEDSATVRDTLESERTLTELQWHKILSGALACILMFLVGAPLGAIIKRGGIGIPFLISILFFIIYTLLTMQGEKLAKHGYISAATGIWFANFVMLVVGIFLLRVARNDWAVFDADTHRITFARIKKKLKSM